MESVLELLKGPAGQSLFVWGTGVWSAVIGGGPAVIIILIGVCTYLLFQQKRVSDQLVRERAEYEVSLKEERERVDEERERVDVVRKEATEQIVQCVDKVGQNAMTTKETVQLLQEVVAKLKT